MNLETSYTCTRLIGGVCVCVCGEAVVGLKDLGNISADTVHDLVNTPWMVLYELGDIVYLVSYSHVTIVTVVQLSQFFPCKGLHRRALLGFLAGRRPSW
jgi:hypothetical protein